MTTVWIVLGIVVVCLLALAIGRLRGASRTVQRILDEERAETERREAEPEDEPAHDDPMHRTRRSGL